MATFNGTPVAFLGGVVGGIVPALSASSIGPASTTYAVRTATSPKFAWSVHHGNSLTRDSTTSNELITSYPAVLNGLLKASQASHPGQAYIVVRRGTGSITTPELQALFLSEVHQHYNPALPCIVHINEVGNHITQGATQQGAIDAMIAYCNNAKSLGWLVCFHVPPPRASITDPGYEGSFSAWRGTQLASWQGACDYFRTHPEHYDFIVDWPVVPELADPKNTTYYTADGVHFNDAGAAVKASSTHAEMLTWF